VLSWIAIELNCGELDKEVRISIIKIWIRRDCTWTGLREVGILRGGEVVGFWTQEESGKIPRWQAPPGGTWAGRHALAQ